MVQRLWAVFYLPHFVAEGLGAFRDEGLSVELVGCGLGEQWDVVARGDAELTIGAPLYTMRWQAEAGKQLVNFCAAVGTNPWYLIGRSPEPDFSWADLVGRTVVGSDDPPTPRLCLRWILQTHGIESEQVRFLKRGSASVELETFRAGSGDYLLHSLQTAAPFVLSNKLALVQDLATPTGRVPWSAYSTLPERLQTHRSELVAFTRAIGRALRWLKDKQSTEVAALIAPSFPGFAEPVLAEIVRRYQQVNLWPSSPHLAKSDFERFRSILMSAGWLKTAVSYEDQVDRSLAVESGAAFGAAPQ